MIRTLTIAAAGLALTACATQAPYQQAQSSTASGYADQAIEKDRFKVSFRGNSSTPKDQVETYLLYRAAELTLEQGFDYFLVVDRDTESNSRLRATGGSPAYSRFGFHYNYYHPAYGWYGMYDPFWGDAPTYTEITKYDASAEILLRSGTKPADEARAFDARDVIENLGPIIKRPE